MKLCEKYVVENWQKLGAGSFSQVRRITKISNKKNYALKITNINKCEAYVFRNIVNEVQILQSVKHSNIVEFQDVYKDEQNIYLVLEYCKNDLEKVLNNIRDTEFLDIGYAIKWSSGIANGLNCLAELNIVHRDLKPANILIEKKIPKICDFNLAVKLENGEKRKECVGTIGYAPPEVHCGKEYGLEFDVWSFGCILYEMMMMKFPFEKTEDDNVMLERFMKGYKKIPGYSPHDFKDQDEIITFNNLKTVVENCIVVKQSGRWKAKVIAEDLKYYLKHYEDLKSTKI